VRAKTALNKLQLNFIEKPQAPTQTQRFWVYLPPLNSVTDAERKTIELKKLGIKDVLVMQDPEWKNAISFGVFLDEQRAITLLKDLKAKGVSNAVQTVQNATENTVSLRLEPLTDAELIAVKKLQAGLAQSTLTEVSCYN
jgi:mannose/fructose/N-acetylgalactosamine-specific phosphotransferase system component IIB